MYSRDGGRSLHGLEVEFTAESFEFTAPETVAETRSWAADVQRGSDQPAMVLVGFVENGRWVNWNLAEVPRPSVPEAFA